MAGKSGGYKSPFANTPAARQNERKKRRKPTFFEKLGMRFGDAAADYMLDEGGPAVRGNKKPRK